MAHVRGRFGRGRSVPLQTEIEVEGRLPKAIEVCAYYVVSELLTNIAKHARASLATVTVAIDGPLLWFCVSDDGVGGLTTRAARV
jgi:signal transduction histidine kinase